MIGPTESLILLLSVPLSTLLAAFVYLTHQQAERIARLVLLSIALVAALATMVGGNTQTMDVPLLISWLPAAGIAPVVIGPQLDAITLSLVVAVALLTLVTVASLPPGWRRLDTALLLVASTAVHVACIGDHLLLRLAAIEVLLLSVFLLIAMAGSGAVVGLLMSQRLAAGVLLLAGLIAGWHETATRILGVDVNHWVPLLMLLAALVLGGGLPFHRGLHLLAGQPAAVRAHLSALLLLVSGAIVLPVAGRLAPSALFVVTVGLVGSAVLAVILSLFAQSPARAQLWMWASQLGFVVTLTLQIDPVLAVTSWVCLALIRPAAAQSVDIAVVAMGDAPYAARRWGGLAGSLPAACWLGVIGAVAVAGLPPFGLFASLAGLSALLPVTATGHLPLIAATVFVALPALRLGLWPFIGTARSSVMAPREQTRVPATTIGLVAVCAVIGLLWPLVQMVTGALPPTSALVVSAAVTVSLLGVGLLVGHRDRTEPIDAEPPPWRQLLDDGFRFPHHPGAWLRLMLRQVAWLVDLLSLLPAGMARLLRGSAWLLTWSESRPLWWVGLSVVGVMAAVLLGGAR